jgi:hypothetical protein
MSTMHRVHGYAAIRAGQGRTEVAEGMGMEPLENDLDECCLTCVRFHQPRDHSVPCQSCRRPTFDFHAICDRCRQPPPKLVPVR